MAFDARQVKDVEGVSIDQPVHHQHGVGGKVRWFQMTLTKITRGNIQNETHLGANYSLICVNKTSSELEFFLGRKRVWAGAKRGEKTLSWGETTWGETDLGQNDLFPL